MFIAYPICDSDVFYVFAMSYTHMKQVIPLGFMTMTPWGRGGRGRLGWRINGEEEKDTSCICGIM